MADIYDMAKELGGALARTDEYRELWKASQAVDDEVKTAYEEKASQLQGKAAFQRLIAAQANFEKVMQRVNQTMAQGLQDGAQSRIILSS
jgi:cell fate (sporulation/competence/biofilm development) regulator YlbF (YheA/YmcA/DUF963 family)